ncbi:hypothetical protein [Silvimonas amylolytica]|uniref:hypothetical protein n=1 Tax=Silvimonas amylolytica TaxID=449663 RepID=UPI00166548FF|nr:hypothetical protein [Silvimonas amylolytica]
MRFFFLKPSSRVAWWLWFVASLFLLPLAAFNLLAFTSLGAYIVWVGVGLFLLMPLVLFYLIMVTSLPLKYRILVAILVALTSVVCLFPRATCASEQQTEDGGCN